MNYKYGIFIRYYTVGIISPTVSRYHPSTAYSKYSSVGASLTKTIFGYIRVEINTRWLISKSSNVLVYLLLGMN
jgi:hypothetical protein